MRRPRFASLLAVLVAAGSVACPPAPRAGRGGEAERREQRRALGCVE